MTNANRRNPFGLTYRQCELMDSLVRLGSVKAIGHEEQANHKTIRNTLREAFKKMGCSTQVQAAVMWDRKRREGVEIGGKQRVRSVFDMAGSPSIG